MEIIFKQYEDTFETMVTKENLKNRQIGWCTDKKCFIYKDANGVYNYFFESESLKNALERSNINSCNESIQ